MTATTNITKDTTMNRSNNIRSIDDTLEDHIVHTFGEAIIEVLKDRTTYWFVTSDAQNAMMTIIDRQIGDAIVQTIKEVSNPH